MGLVEATRTCLKKYVDFTGRARRAEYWWFYLVTLLVSAVLTVLAVVLFIGAGASVSESGEISFGGGAAAVAAFVLYGLAVLVSLAVTLPLVAAAVRRLHDTDRSGWWYLLTFVPVANVVLIVFWALEGTPGPNRFGPSPEGVAPHGAPTTTFDQGYGHPGQA